MTINVKVCVFKPLPNSWIIKLNWEATLIDKSILYFSFTKHKAFLWRWRRCCPPSLWKMCSILVLYPILLHCVSIIVLHLIDNCHIKIKYFKRNSYMLDKWWRFISLLVNIMLYYSVLRSLWNAHTMLPERRTSVVQNHLLIKSCWMQLPFMRTNFLDKVKQFLSVYQVCWIHGTL